MEPTVQSKRKKRKKEVKATSRKGSSSWCTGRNVCKETAEKDPRSHTLSTILISLYVLVVEKPKRKCLLLRIWSCFAGLRRGVVEVLHCLIFLCLFISLDCCEIALSVCLATIDSILQDQWWKLGGGRGVVADNTLGAISLEFIE